MERAALALVDTNLPVTEISREMGYPDPYHVSRVFRRVMGQSPRLHRQTQRAGAPGAGGEGAGRLTARGDAPRP